jgi:ADP-ribose pyrophosphatase
MDNMPNQSSQPEKQVLLTASRFTVERVSQQLDDGSTMSREVIKHPGAVVIVPVLDDGRICLIRNYRISIDQELLELPAGTLEPPEPPIETARRELIEETGYRCNKLVPLCEFYMSPGILDEHMYCYLATGLTVGAPARELGEQISNYPVTIAELANLLRTGQIVDSKSLSALLYYAMLGVDKNFHLKLPVG